MEVVAGGSYRSANDSKLNTWLSMENVTDNMDKVRPVSRYRVEKEMAEGLKKIDLKVKNIKHDQKRWTPAGGRAYDSRGINQSPCVVM